MARIEFIPEPTDDLGKALQLLQNAKGKQQQEKSNKQYQTQALEHLAFIEKTLTTKQEQEQVRKLREKVNTDPAFAKEFVEAAKKPQLPQQPIEKKKTTRVTIGGFRIEG